MAAAASAPPSGPNARPPGGPRKSLPAPMTRVPPPANGDELGDDACRDFGHRLGADLQADGGVEAFQVGLGGQAGLDEVLSHERDLSPAAHHSEVGGGLAQDGGEGL